MTEVTPQITPPIRRLWPMDQPAVLKHFLNLDRDIRHMRFGGGVGEGFLRDYADGILKVGSVIFGAFPDNELRAVGELRGLLDAWPVKAEAAFSVERAWQDRGIGDALVTRVIAAAQNRGVNTLNMICLPENRKMQHLAVKHDAVLQLDVDEVEARLTPPWPTPGSLAEEFSGEAQGFTQALLRWAA
ncbi:MAG: GNAT family N-acetyltransferase [Rhizobiales bacterium]|nr:GNAT family N-acetyltransferase [Hyphomicrobiales bacterium]